MAAKRYVVGFLLSRYGTAVVLIRKNRPAWQAGRLNGVGGKIEPGETPAEAMAREFREETGLDIAAEEWEEMCTIGWPDDTARIADAEPSSVIFFRHVYKRDDLIRAPRLEGLVPPVTTCTDEQIEVHRTDRLPVAELIPNLTWLVPLAAYTADRYAPFSVAATVAEVMA